MMTDYIHSLISLVNEMSPYLLLGFFIAGLLHSFVPHRAYARHLSSSDMGAVLKAALFGIPLPLCSCGVIPTTVSLRKNGASEAASTSFLISTPQTGVDSIAATYSLLGLPFAVIRPIAALITAIFGGKLVGIFSSRQGEINGDESDCGGSCQSSDRPKTGFKAKLIDALNYGFVSMIQDVGKWLVVGLLLAALIAVLVPSGFFAKFADYPLLNMLIVLCIAAPMYVCATGSIPVALSLMLKGMSPGAAFVLLMAGPATNMASILVIGKVFGKRSLVIYLSSIILGAIGFGLIIDYMLPRVWFTEHLANVVTMPECCRPSTPIFNILCSIAFAAMLVWAFVAKRINSSKNKENQQTINTTIMKKEYKIKGMMCNHCKANVETNLAKVAGVTSVTVDLPSGTAYVEGNHNPSDVIAMIKSLGYEYVG